jgi:2'-5' RNA ligase
MPRIFLAIKLTLEIGDAIAEHVRYLRREWPNATIGWVSPENQHLTLKFLGEIPAEKLNGIAVAVERAVNRFTSFNIEIAGTGTFPPRGTPRVLWIGITENERLSRLHENVEKELASIGFPREKKSFHPHLTLGRVRAPKFVSEITELHRRLGFAPVRLRVDEFSVIESQVDRTGPTYFERSKHILRSE